jgi:hypothetical protein
MPRARYCLERGATRQDLVLAIFGMNGTPPVRQAGTSARWCPSVRGGVRLGVHAQCAGLWTNGARSTNFAQNPRRRGHKRWMACIWKTRARKVSSGCELGHQGSLQLRWGGVRAHHPDVAENGGHTTGHASFRDKIAPALVRCPIVPQRSVTHLHAAAGEMCASCSHDLGVRT